MKHWLRDFVNAALPRPTYVAVKWARLLELAVAFRLWATATRFRFLRALERDLSRDGAAEAPVATTPLEDAN